MALDPNKKFLYFNKDASTTESDESLCFPVSKFIGIEAKTSSRVLFYFEGSKGVDATTVRVSHNQHAYIKTFMSFLVDEINFGEKAFIKVYDHAQRVSYPSDISINMITDVVPIFTLEDSTIDLGTVLSVENGGTGASTLTADGVLFGNGTSAISAVDLSTNGNIIVGGATPAAFSGAFLAGAGLAATVGDGTLQLTVETLNQDTTGTAAIATTVTVADESTDTTCFPLFATAATGDLNLKSGSNLTFNSSSGLLTCGAVSAQGFEGDFTGDVLGNVEGSLEGNADTATILATARAINGVDFDGSAAITVTAAGSTLSDTVTVAKGGTGLTTVAANTILTGNGTSALTSEANLTFSGDRLIIGANSEISPHVRFWNDENQVNLGVTSTSDGILAGSADGDFAINCTGDHNVLFGQNNAIAAKIDTDGDFNLNRKFTITADADASYEGDVVYFGGTTSMVKGRIYHYKSDDSWELANPSTAVASDGLLAVSLGAASDTNGMLLRGMVTLDHDPGAVGDVLYLDEQQVASAYGAATSGAPAGNNNIVRVIGYCLDVSKGKIWFNPDNTFVEVTA